MFARTLSWLLLLVVVVTGSASPSFVIDGQQFLKDGQPFRLVSGSMHYFRSHPNDWADRLSKMRWAGLNAVQTVIPWNLHQPQAEGPFVWEGFSDLTRFIRTAAEQDLLVVLRPGPYICAEHEFGGLPYWLLSRVGGGAPFLRSGDERFLGPVRRWWEELLGRVVRPLLYSDGGPVVMVQLENEYGSFGNDRAGYLSVLRDWARELLGEGAVILHSTDGPSDRMLGGTRIDGVYQTVDFGPTGLCLRVCGASIAPSLLSSG
jgi:beta-galactosidase